MISAEDIESVDWPADVTFIDTRNLTEENLTDKPCPTCGREMITTMAGTTTDGPGPAWICISCARVDRV